MNKENKVQTAEEILFQAIKIGLGLEGKAFKKENPVLFSVMKHAMIEFAKTIKNDALNSVYEQNEEILDKGIIDKSYPDNLIV
jgi:hypothetical protein